MKTLFGKITHVLFAPREFFAKIKAEKQIKTILFYLVILLVLDFVLNALSIIYVQPVFNNLFSTMLGSEIPETYYDTGQIVPSFITYTTGGVLSSFIVATILHFWLMLFRKGNEWIESYKLYVYSRTPVLVFGWIPLLNIIAWIYSIYLMVVGVQKLHGLDKKTAILVIVLPLGLFFIASIILVTITFSTLRS